MIATVSHDALLVFGSSSSGSSSVREVRWCDENDEGVDLRIHLVPFGKGGVVDARTSGCKPEAPAFDEYDLLRTERARPRHAIATTAVYAFVVNRNFDVRLSRAKPRKHRPEQPEVVCTGRSTHALTERIARQVKVVD